MTKVDSERTLVPWSLQVSGQRWNKRLSLDAPLNKSKRGQNRVKARAKDRAENSEGLAQSNLNTSASLWALSRRQPDVSGFKASLEHRVSPGVCGEVGAKPDLFIYLHLLPPIALVFKEKRQGQKHCYFWTCTVTISLTSALKKKNHPYNLLIARLTEVWHTGCVVRRPTRSKCEGSLRIPDSDEKCVAVRWLTPEQPRPAGTAAPHPLPTNDCALNHVLHVRQRPVPRWVAITWWGVAVISPITGHSCPIRLNITWLSWPRPHARLRNKAIEKCAPRGSYDSVNSCVNPLQGKERAGRNSLHRKTKRLTMCVPGWTPSEAENSFHVDGEWRLSGGVIMFFKNLWINNADLECCDCLCAPRSQLSLIISARLYFPTFACQWL